MKRIVLIAGGWGLLSCGAPNQASSVLTPTGGELCLAERKVCLEVPSGGIDKQIAFTISPATQTPPAVIGEGFDIGPDGTTFLKPAKVSFRYDFLPDDAGFEVTVLRLYTQDEGGEWVPLFEPQIDRVRHTISGTVEHLSPFVLLRADRLPDGGLPIEGDGGTGRDSGVIVVPPRPDAGPPDSGRPDAGPPDAGRPDAGPPDSGRPDAGPPDAGPPDAGPPDAGPPDAGPPDAGPPDAGPPDAGPPDAGVDAGTDAGLDDAG